MKIPRLNSFKLALAAADKTAVATPDPRAGKLAKHFSDEYGKVMDAEGNTVGGQLWPSDRSDTTGVLKPYMTEHNEARRHLVLLRSIRDKAEKKRIR